MKYFFIVLSFIFCSNFANAANQVGKLLKYCKIAQKYDYPNSVGLKKMTEGEYVRATICVTRLTTLMLAGEENCKIYNAYLKGNSSLTAVERRTISKAFNAVKGITANSFLDIDQLTASFINFAQANPKYWNFNISSFRDRFLGSDFPCIIKPN